MEEKPKNNMYKILFFILLSFVICVIALSFIPEKKKFTGIQRKSVCIDSGSCFSSGDSESHEEVKYADGIPVSFTHFWKNGSTDMKTFYVLQCANETSCIATSQEGKKYSITIK